MISDTMILNDNLMYLDAWMKQNAALRENLQVIDSELVWTHLGESEKVSLKKFYLPELLYNERFRNDLLDPKTMNAEDLFRIIRVHVLADEFYHNTTNEVSITNLYQRTDKSGKPCIVFQDSLGHQFIVKNNIEKVIKVYETLKAKGIVKYSDFKRELER